MFSPIPYPTLKKKGEKDHAKTDKAATNLIKVQEKPKRKSMQTHYRVNNDGPYRTPGHTRPQLATPDKTDYIRPQLATLDHNWPRRTTIGHTGPQSATLGYNWPYSTATSHTRQLAK